MPFYLDKLVDAWYFLTDSIFTTLNHYRDSQPTDSWEEEQKRRRKSLEEQDG